MNNWKPENDDKVYIAGIYKGDEFTVVEHWDWNAPEHKRAYEEGRAYPTKELVEAHPPTREYLTSLDPLRSERWGWAARRTTRSDPASQHHSPE